MTIRLLAPAARPLLLRDNNTVRPVLPAPRTKTKPKLQCNGMPLTNQGGLRRKNPSWALVERVVRELDQGEGNSFCCLNSPDGSYIQTLHGCNGYHAEWRVSGAGDKGHIHWRASYPGFPSRT